MSKYLGLDLGTNSIGWALVYNAKIENILVTTFPELANTLDNKPRRFNKIKFKFSKLSKSIKKNWKLLVLHTITLTMFSLTLAIPNNWQFWLNLGIGCLIVTLSKKIN